MKCQLVAFLLVSVLSVIVLSEMCKFKDDCSLEACANNGTVACEHDFCTCVNSHMDCMGDKHECDRHGPCHEHGHGHHAQWHCFDGECRCF